MAIDMKQRAIPFIFMRGGTSRGPYFSRTDLPEDLDTLASVLIAAIGAGHPLNIDGIGGGKAVTTKVAMLSLSEDDWADIDYFFAQVSVEEKRVDFKPSCGNILSGVGPAAFEMGLITPQGTETEIRIRAVNSGARIVARVQTPDGTSYSGDTQIDGVPGTGSPITLQFADTVGGATGAFLPTGRLIDTFDDIEVTCMDVAMPMVTSSSRAISGRGDAKSAPARLKTVNWKRPHLRIDRAVAAQRPRPANRMPLRSDISRFQVERSSGRNAERLSCPQARARTCINSTDAPK